MPQKTTLRNCFLKYLLIRKKYQSREALSPSWWADAMTLKHLMWQWLYSSEGLWACGDAAGLPPHQAEARSMLLKTHRYLPLKSQDLSAAARKLTSGASQGLGFFFLNLKEILGSEFYWLQIPVSSGPAAKAAASWSQPKVGFLS